MRSWRCPGTFQAFEEPESSQLFIELVYEAHKRQLGEFFGRSITGFFSDADNRRMPHGVLAETYYPWSGNFAGEFERSFGYPVGPHLPDILSRKPCQAAVDYWLLAGRRHPVALLPGEVAVFTPSGVECRKPARILVRQLLAAEAEVAWQAPNAVTLCRWEDAAGQLMDRQALSAQNVTVFFCWQNLEDLADLTLLVPMLPQAARLDGRPLGAATPRLLLSDEEYQALALPGSGRAGGHVLELRFAAYEEATYVSWRNPCHLEGEFDCEVEALDGGGAATSEASYYNFFLTLPAAVRVTLRKRRRRLALDRSWAEQGHPFYSGRARYCFEFRIPDGFRHPVLRFPKAHCQLELTVNGRELGCKAFPPYDFDLAGFRGDCQAELLVENTLGNRLDGYGAPSGLAAVPELLDVGS